MERSIKKPSKETSSERFRRLSTSLVAQQKAIKEKHKKNIGSFKITKYNQKSKHIISETKIRTPTDVGKVVSRPPGGKKGSFVRS